MIKRRQKWIQPHEKEANIQISLVIKKIDDITRSIFQCGQPAFLNFPQNFTLFAGSAYGDKWQVDTFKIPALLKFYITQP